MKLFAFVRRARRPSSAPVPAAPEPTVVASEVDPAASADKRRRRPSGSAAPWKPTLVAISEDAPVTAVAKAKAKPAAAKAKARSPRAARAASYDDFRHYGAPTVLPAFTPTAFLF